MTAGLRWWAAVRRRTSRLLLACLQSRRRPANGSPGCRLGGSGCPVCQGCAEVFVDETDVLVVAQAAAALALMRLAPTCLCAEEQPQQVRQRGACVTPKAAVLTSTPS